MKDHKKRELVDALTAVALKYGTTQQLRERIRNVLLPALAEIEPKANTTAEHTALDVARMLNWPTAGQY